MNETISRATVGSLRSRVRSASGYQCGRLNGFLSASQYGADAQQFATVDPLKVNV